MSNFETRRDPELQRVLTELLESPACPPHTMNFYQLDGYLRALSFFPEPWDEDWAGLIFGDQPPLWQTEEQALQVRYNIRQLVYFHQQQFQYNCCDLPVEVQYLTNREERTDIEQWARGFLQGYIFQEDRWNDLLECVPGIVVDGDLTTESLADKMDAVLYIVSTVADADLAIAQGTPGFELDGVFKRLPVALIDLVGSVKQLVNYQPRIDTVTGIV